MKLREKIIRITQRRYDSVERREDKVEKRKEKRRRRTEKRRANIGKIEEEREQRESRIETSPSEQYTQCAVLCLVLLLVYKCSS